MLKRYCILLLMLFPIAGYTTNKEVTDLDPFKILPIAQQHKVKSIIKKTLSSGNQIRITPLIGGLSQQIYKVEIGSKCYVLRLSNQKLLDNTSEITAMKIATKFDIAPKIYYASAKEGIILMDYIKQQRLPYENMIGSKTHIKLAHLLKKMHHTSISIEEQEHLKDTTVFEKISTRFKQKSNPNSLERKAIEEIKNIAPIFKEHIIKVFCHNDLQPNNLLFDGNRFWLIDWERSAITDPYFDLATISIFLNTNEDPNFEDIYLQTYFNKKPTNKQLSRYFVMKQISLVYYGMLLIDLANERNFAAISEEEIVTLPSLKSFYRETGDNLHHHSFLEKNLAKFGAILLKEALVNMDTAQFKDALIIMQGEPLKIMCP